VIEAQDSSSLQAYQQAGDFLKESDSVAKLAIKEMASVAKAYAGEKRKNTGTGDKPKKIKQRREQTLVAQVEVALLRASGSGDVESLYAETVLLALSKVVADYTYLSLSIERAWRKGKQQKASYEVLWKTIATACTESLADVDASEED
jgi:hypothetical protein